MSDVDYQKAAQLLVDYDADIRAEYNSTPDGAYASAFQLYDEHGPFELTFWDNQPTPQWYGGE